MKLQLSRVALGSAVALSLATTVGLLFAGIGYFQNAERRFADVI